MARNCEYSFIDVNGKEITLKGIPAFKAYLADGGMESLFPGREFPVKPIVQAIKKQIEKPKLETFSNKQDALASLIDFFGQGIQRLHDIGVVNFTNGKEDWAARGIKGFRGDEEGVYYNGKVLIDLAATSKDRMPKVMLHEIGEHFNLRQMIGTQAYDNLQKQIAILAKRPGSEAEIVWNEVKRNYVHLEEGSPLFVSEVIAKLGERDPKAPWYRRLISQIKTFLMTHGLARSFIAGTIKDDEVHTLLVASLQSAARGRVKDRPSFYGGLAQASFAGQTSETADAHARNTAEEKLAAGEDPEKVRRETGWFKGRDGFWRYEINDSDSTFIGKDKLDEITKSRFGRTTVALSDVINHPALFAAYPNIKDVRVAYLGNKDFHKDATFYPETNEIELGGGIAAGEMKAKIIHEIQHRIQDYEGFSPGTSPEEMQDRMMYEKGLDHLSAKEAREAYDNYYKTYGEWEARVAERRANLSEEQRRNAPLAKSADMDEKDTVVLFNGEPIKKSSTEFFHGDKDQNKEIFGQGFMVTKNPTRARAYKIADKSHYKEIRGVVDEQTGNLYIADAGISLHDHIIEIARLPETDMSRFDKIKIPLDKIYSYKRNIFADDTPQFSLPDTIEVDGIQRPMTNAEGRPIHPTEEGIRNFWKWFGDSKAIDDSGKPIVVYHGTTNDFTVFDIGKAGEKDHGWYGTGAYLTPDAETASAYADYDQEKTGQNVIPLYVKIEQPFMWSQDIAASKTKGQSDEFTRMLKKSGYDGVFVENKYADPKYAKRYEIVAFDPSQVKSAVGNVGSYSEAQEDIRFSRPSEDHFYSALSRAVDKAPEKVFGNAQQIKLWINANSSKFDVKRDEIYWSGLNDWLDMQTGKVSRDDVLKFMDENGVKVEDVVLGEGDSKAIDFDEWAKANLPKDYKRMQEADDETKEVISYHLHQAYNRAVEGGYDNGALKPKHDNAQLTLPGGTDYRELVVTIPTTEKYNEHDSTHFGDVGKGKQIAWIRHNTRLTANGGKVLFLEEIQSQRGAEGRTKGFTKNEELKNKPETYKEIVVGDEIKGWGTVQDIRPSDNGILFNVGGLWIGENKFTLDKIADRNTGHLNTGLNKSAVPPAPFITSADNKATNAYISLLMKKAVSEAIDNGHTSVAWTTGDQQADRYDLSKHVDEIEAYARNDDGSRRIMLSLRDGGSTIFVTNKDGLITEAVGEISEGKGRPLADVIGKPLADSILANPEMHTVSGKGLSIGGGWTQAMYGNEQGLNAQGKPSLILQAASEIARKFGGEVKSQIITKVPYRDSLLGKQADGEKMIKEGRAWKAPALIITPQMRDKILNEGMPLFSRPTEEPETWKSWSENVIDKLDEMADKVYSQRLALFSTRQIIEMAKKYLPKISQYERGMQQRGAMVSNYLRLAGQTLDKWRSMTKPEIRRTNSVIQDSSLADVDASRDWRGMYRDMITIDTSMGGQKDVMGYRVYTQAKLNKPSQDELGHRAATLGGQHITKNSVFFEDKAKADFFVNELKSIEEKQAAFRANNNYEDDNIKRKEEQERLRTEFETLPEKGKEIYHDTNDLHNRIFQERLETLENQIDEAIIDAKRKEQLKKALRLRFESGNLQFYYAPLARHGNHWFYGTDAQGKNWFRTFETPRQRDNALEKFADNGGTINGRGTSIRDMQNLRMEGGSDAFVLEVKELLDKSLPKELSDALQDDIYQMYLATLPDISVRHNSMHRKGTLGFDEDAMRSFAGAIHHGASQLANMKYGREMDQTLRDHKEALAVASSKFQSDKKDQEIAAAKMLLDDWNNLSSNGLLEAKIDAAEGFEKATLTEAKDLRDKFKHIDNIDSIQASLKNFLGKKEKIRELSKSITPETSRKAADTIEELIKAYHAMTNVNSTAMDQVAGWIRQVGFMYMLGFGLSSGTVNMLQTPIVAMPVVAGKFGLSKTVSAFNTSYNLMMKAIINKAVDEDGNKSITTELQKLLDNPNTDINTRNRLFMAIDAMNIFKEEGDISRTQQFDAIGIGREGSEYGGAMQELSKKAGWMFHHGERVNREVTLYAAYTLARDSGMKHQAAIDYARYANNRAHGDYSSENAARIFRGWPASIALQFKKYPQMMLYLWGKTAVDYLNGWKKLPDGPEKEAAKLQSQEAGRTLAGLFLMQGAVAGAFGLPLMGAIQAVINAIGGAVSDPDEPWDVEEKAREWLTEIGGQTFATAITKGALNAATPINFADRLDLANVFFREPLKELEGRDAATNYIAQFAGPTGGLLQKWFEGGKLIQEGELLRGIEMATPKVIGDVLKSARFMSEDATSLQGAKLKDMTAMENLFQLVGFSSSELETAYAERGYAKREEAARLKVHQKLVNKAARALLEDTEYPQEEIDAWNEKHPEWRIDRSVVNKSEQAIKRNEKLRGIRGYSVNPRMVDIYEKTNLRPDLEED